MPFGCQAYSSRPIATSRSGSARSAFDPFEHGRIELGLQEADLVALRVHRHVGQRVARHDLGQLLAGAGDHVDVEPEPLRDQPLGLGGDLERRAELETTTLPLCT